MKITNKTSVLVLAKKETPGLKNPSQKYYSLVIMQDADAGSISCTKEVFDAVEDGKVNVLDTEYNQKYESFRAVGVASAPAEKATK